MTARPKFPYWRSEAHLRNVASLPCMSCGKHGETQAAHANQAIYGKCKARKASDEYTAALCVGCHTMVDSNPIMTRARRNAIWDAAYQATLTELARRGLMPDHLRTQIDKRCA